MTVDADRAIQSDRTDDHHYIESFDSDSIEELNDEPTIHPSARIRESTLGSWIRIGREVRM